MDPGVILETEGSVRKTQKRAFFHYKTVKNGTPNLTSPYTHGLFTIVFMKKIFEKISHQGQRPEIRLSLSLKKTLGPHQTNIACSFCKNQSTD